MISIWIIFIKNLKTIICYKRVNNVLNLSLKYLHYFILHNLKTSYIKIITNFCDNTQWEREL